MAPIERTVVILIAVLILVSGAVIFAGVVFMKNNLPSYQEQSQ